MPYFEMASYKMLLSLEPLIVQHQSPSEYNSLTKFNLHLSLLVPGPLSAWQSLAQSPINDSLTQSQSLKLLSVPITWHIPWFLCMNMSSSSFQMRDTTRESDERLRSIHVGDRVTAKTSGPVSLSWRVPQSSAIHNHFYFLYAIDLYLDIHPPSKITPTRLSFSAP